MNKTMPVLALLICMLFTTWSVHADTAQMQVAKPFINVHTGPAVGYPIFHVIEKGEWVTVLKKRTTWFKVALEDGREGWIAQQDVQDSLTVGGEDIVLDVGSKEDYLNRDFELSVFGTAIDSVSGLTVAASWVHTPNIISELSYSQAVGDFSKNEVALLRIQHTAFPEWVVSPYISLGAGVVKTTPKATLVQSGDEVRDSEVMQLGFGLRYYMSRNFIVRLEYKNLLVLTDRDQQEELNQWDLGFAVYF